MYKKDLRPMVLLVGLIVLIITSAIGMMRLPAPDAWTIGAAPIELDFYGIGETKDITIFLQDGGYVISTAWPDITIETVDGVAVITLPAPAE